MPDTPETSAPKALPPPRRWPTSRRALAGGALVAVLIAGAALGAGATHLAQHWEPRGVLLLQPAPIDSLQDRRPVAVKGEVAEIFGNKFVVQDGSGRALVDTGPRGEQRGVVAKGETLTVQGRFDRGVIRAEVLTHADGRSETFGPPGPPHDRGPKGGPKDGPGPRADRDPPPPGSGEAPDEDTVPRRPPLTSDP